MTKTLNHCFCFSARNGCIILAILGILWNLRSIYADIKGFLGLNTEFEEWIETLEDLKTTTVIGEESYHHFVGYINFYRNNLSLLCSCDVVISCLSLISNFLLMWGVSSRRAMLLLPYLVLNILELFLVLVCFTVAIFVAVKVASLIVALSMLTLFLIIAVLAFYFWLVILSYYLVLDKQNRIVPVDKSDFGEEDIGDFDKMSDKGDAEYNDIMDRMGSAIRRRKSSKISTIRNDEAIKSDDEGKINQSSDPSGAEAIDEASDEPNKEPIDESIEKSEMKSIIRSSVNKNDEFYRRFGISREKYNKMRLSVMHFNVASIMFVIFNLTLNGGFKPIPN